MFGQLQLSTEWVQALQAVLLAAIAAYVAVKNRAYDAAARESAERDAKGKELLAELDKRILTLEGAPRAPRSPNGER